MTLKSLKIEAEKAIEKAQDLKGLNNAFKKYLGKKAELTQILRSLEKLAKAKRVKVGKEANILKNSLRIKFDQKARELKEQVQKQAEEKEWIDNLPVKNIADIIILITANLTDFSLPYLV